MKASLKFENPNELQTTLTVTMSLGGWRKVRDAIREGGGSAAYYGELGLVADSIREMVDKAEKVFTHRAEEESDAADD